MEIIHYSGLKTIAVILHCQVLITIESISFTAIIIWAGQFSGGDKLHPKNEPLPICLRRGFLMSA